MDAAAERLEFAPPAEPAAVRGFVIAVVAHLLLAAALTWGINWKKDVEEVAAEAELWSAVPSVAAPPAPAPMPVAPPPPAPVQAPPPPRPAPKPEPVVEPPAQRDAQIAIEREKRKQEQLEEKRIEQEALKKAQARRLKEQERREELAEQLAEKKLAEKKLAEKKLAEKKLADRRAAELAADKAAEKAEAEERKRDELAKAASAARARQEAASAAKSKQEVARLEALRKENIARMMQSATGGAGSPDSGGTAKQASGPSASYGGRVQARVRPYIVFPDDAPGNPQAEVEVRTSPDGTIVGSRIVKPSGVKAWDDAVLAALTKAEVLPRDVDGRVPTPLVIVFKRRN